MRASRYLVVALLILLAVPSFAMPRIHLGGITVGVGYDHFSGPGWGYPGYYPGYYPRFSPWYPGWGYSSLWWDPFYSPYYGGYTTRTADKGEVHIKDAAAKGEVYIDGAYAGLVKDLRTLWLSPGAYNVEVRTPNEPPRMKRIYVLTGKSLDVHLEEAAKAEVK